MVKRDAVDSKMEELEARYRAAGGVGCVKECAYIDEPACHDGRCVGWHP